MIWLSKIFQNVQELVEGRDDGMTWGITKETAIDKWLQVTQWAKFENKVQFKETYLKKIVI